MRQISNGKDISLELLDGLDWKAGAVRESLEKVAKHASEHAAVAIEWYRDRRAWKRRLARTTRTLVILLVAAAGALPMVQQLLLTSAGTSTLSPVWPSLIAAAAALLLAFDKFFGLSSGWIRFIVAEDAIRSALQAFEFGWQGRLASMAAREPAPEEVQQALEEIKTFAGRINAIVSDETQRWVAEFQAALGDIEEKARAAEAASRTGAVSVTVTNGDAVDPPGWTLDADFGPARTVRGRTAALAGLSPGDHVLRLSARAKDKELHAEAIAAVQSGKSTAVEMTLA